MLTLALGAVGIVVAAAVLAYAILVAPRRLQRTEIEALIPGLSPVFDGYTIAALSDLHYGGLFWPRAHAERAATIARSSDPDLVVLLGDYGVSSSRFARTSRHMYEMAMRELAPVLRSIEPRDGMLAVLGNHDYDTNAWGVARWLQSLGAGVLANRSAILEREGSRLVIGGVHDPHYAPVDPQGGCAAAPADAPRIVLSHTPDAVTDLDPTAHIALVLAGHTHGGQVVFPFIGALLRNSSICGRHAASGWVPNPYAPLYVTTGVGVAIPLRLFCPPEVLIVRLRTRTTGGRVQGSGGKGTERGQELSLSRDPHPEVVPEP
ncbi:MAG TPA: metallophosphoesterase [Gemmatimonadaceae bacterium]